MKKTFYKTDKKTKEEFVKFLDWAKKNKISNDLEGEVDRYCKELDISLYNLQVLNGANTRSPKTELILAIVTSGLAIILSYFVGIPLIDWLGRTISSYLGA